MTDQPSLATSECPSCGAAILNAEVHQRWHDEVVTIALLKAAADSRQDQSR